MDLISSVSGAAVVAVIGNEKAVVVDFIANEKLAEFALKKDTGTRVSLDAKGNKFILGSWAEGIDCFDLTSSTKLWHSNYAGYTDANIIEGSKELCVAGLKNDPNRCRILNLESGIQTRYLENCGELLAKNALRIGCDSPRRALVAFDSEWKCMGSFEWKCFGLWSFAFDEAGVIVVSGPSGYAGSFVPGLETAIAEVSPHEYFFRIESVCWNKRRECFFAVVSEFEGRPERALLKLEHTLKEFEVIRKFPLASREVFCDERYLVAESGFVFDLETQSELNPLNWASVLKEAKRC